MSAQALIVLAHGSRNFRANQAFLEMVEDAGRKSGMKNMFGAFFSLAEPGLEDVVQKLCREGIEKIVVFPYFLLDGSHVEKDIPEQVRLMQDKFPRVRFDILNSLEHEPLMKRLLVEKAKMVGME